MSSITRCDKCRKQQKDGQRGWISVSVRGGFDFADKGLRDRFGSWDFCDQCAEDVAKKVLPSLEN